MTGGAKPCSMQQPGHRVHLACADVSSPPRLCSSFLHSRRVLSLGRGVPDPHNCPRMETIVRHLVTSTTQKDERRQRHSGKRPNCLPKPSSFASCSRAFSYRANAICDSTNGAHLDSAWSGRVCHGGSIDSKALLVYFRLHIRSLPPSQLIGPSCVVLIVSRTMQTAAAALWQTLHSHTRRTLARRMLPRLMHALSEA